MKLEAIKRQGQRTDLTSTPLVGKLKGKETAEIIGEAVGESREQVRRYIRLTELIPPMLNMVDEDRLSIRSAVELSYLPHEQQRMLFYVIEAEDRVPSHAESIKMRTHSKEGRLNNDAIVSIMQENKPVRVEHFKLLKERIQRFFPADTPAQTIEETIIKALELWYLKQ